MSGFAFFISLVIAVQCVLATTLKAAEPIGPLTPITRLKSAFLSTDAETTCIASGSQCWAAGTIPAGFQSNGCAPTACCGGLVCGGTSDDNQWWKGCRPSNTNTANQAQCTGSTTPTGPASPAPTGPPASPAPGPPATTTTGTAGTTTRYWDCCKASCSWPGKAAVNAPVANCAKDGVTVVSSNNANVCTNSGSVAFMCNNNQPFVSGSVALGFAACSIAGKTEADWCSACYELTFTSGPVSGKRMIVQVTNTGSDLGAGHFDLEIPGGGVGIYNGCGTQWGASTSGWGAQYGGISSVSQCSVLPSQLQSGCQFRWGWFGGADNPTMNFRRVKCPAALVALSGSRRNDDNSYTLASGTS